MSAQRLFYCTFAQNKTYLTDAKRQSITYSANL